MEPLSRLKHHFTFSVTELRDIIVVMLVLSFIFGFDDGSQTFVLSNWLMNFLQTLLLVALALLWHISVQKAIGLWTGYKVEYKMWSYGLAVGFILTIASKGNLILLLPGGVIFHAIEKYRVGRWRHGMNYGHMGWIAASGPIASIVLGMFVKQIMNMFDFVNPMMSQLIYITFLLGFFTMLPIPPMPGIQLFFGTRMGYIFAFGCILGYVALYLSGIFSLLFAVLIGIVCYIVYYLIFEKGAW